MGGIEQENPQGRERLGLDIARAGLRVYRSQRPKGNQFPVIGNGPATVRLASPSRAEPIGYYCSKLIVNIMQHVQRRSDYLARSHRCAHTRRFLFYEHPAHALSPRQHSPNCAASRAYYAVQPAGQFEQHLASPRGDQHGKLVRIRLTRLFTPT